MSATAGEYSWDRERRLNAERSVRETERTARAVADVPGRTLRELVDALHPPGRVGARAPMDATLARLRALADEGRVHEAGDGSGRWFPGPAPATSSSAAPARPLVLSRGRKVSLRDRVAASIPDSGAADREIAMALGVALVDVQRELANLFGLERAHRAGGQWFRGPSPIPPAPPASLPVRTPAVPESPVSTTPDLAALKRQPRMGQIVDDVLAAVGRRPMSQRDLVEETSASQNQVSLACRALVAAGEIERFVPEGSAVGLYRVRPWFGRDLAESPTVASPVAPVPASSPPAEPAALLDGLRAEEEAPSVPPSSSPADAPPAPATTGGAPDNTLEVADAVALAPPTVVGDSTVGGQASAELAEAVAQRDALAEECARLRGELVAAITEREHVINERNAFRRQYDLSLELRDQFERELADLLAIRGDAPTQSQIKAAVAGLTAGAGVELDEVRPFVNGILAAAENLAAHAEASAVARGHMPDDGWLSALSPLVDLLTFDDVVPALREMPVPVLVEVIAYRRKTTTAKAEGRAA